MDTPYARFLILPLLFAGAAAILVATSGVAAISTWMPVPPRHGMVDSLATPRCAECGVVTSTRAIAATGHQEITVRMHDGASHVFVDAPSSLWRPGQRLIVIGANY